MLRMSARRLLMLQLWMLLGVTELICRYVCWLQLDRGCLKRGLWVMIARQVRIRDGLAL